MTSHMRRHAAIMPIFHGEMPSSADLSADLHRRKCFPRMLNIAWKPSNASVASSSILQCSHGEYAIPENTTIYIYTFMHYTDQPTITVSICSTMQISGDATCMGGRDLKVRSRLEEANRSRRRMVDVQVVRCLQPPTWSIHT